jgi:hypothetical protein
LHLRGDIVLKRQGGEILQNQFVIAEQFFDRKRSPAPTFNATS